MDTKNDTTKSERNEQPDDSALSASPGSDQILEYHGDCFTVNIPQWHFGSKLGVKMSKLELENLQTRIVKYLSKS